MSRPLGHLRLCLLFTPGLCRRAPWDTLRAALQGGVDLVQWRVRSPDRAGAERCARISRAFGAPVIINDHVDLVTRLAGLAAGAHVGQHDTPAARARELLGPERWLGVSTHSPAEIDAACAAGADYLGFGPIFPTGTKGYQSGQPHGALAAAIARSRLPVFAIGGIGVHNLGTVVAAGARHVAVSSAILGATDPETVATAMRRILAARS